MTNAIYKCLFLVIILSINEVCNQLIYDMSMEYWSVIIVEKIIF